MLVIKAGFGAWKTLLLFFPHPLSQVLVTALHCIPANYPHELRRTKTAQCGGSEAQPRLGARDGETRHFASAPVPPPFPSLSPSPPSLAHHLQVRGARPLSGEKAGPSERGGEGSEGMRSGSVGRGKGKVRQKEEAATRWC